MPQSFVITCKTLKQNQGYSWGELQGSVPQHQPQDLFWILEFDTVCRTGTLACVEAMCYERNTLRVNVGKTIFIYIIYFPIKFLSSTLLCINKKRRGYVLSHVNWYLHSGSKNSTIIYKWWFVLHFIKKIAKENCFQLSRTSTKHRRTTKKIQKIV